MRIKHHIQTLWAKTTEGGRVGSFSALPWIAFIVGLTLLVLAALTNSSTALKSVLFSVGSLIFTGGLFSFFLKSYQFMNLFSDELLKVFKSDEFSEVIRDAVYFNDLRETNLREAGETIGNRLLSEESPDVSFAVARKIGEICDAARFDFYSKKHDRTITIQSYNPGTGEIVIEDELSVQLVACHEGTTFNYYTSINGETNIRLEYLRVNGDDCSSFYCAQKKGYDLELSGCKSYEVRRKYTRTYKLQDDPFIRVSFSRLNAHFDVQVHNRVPSALGVKLLANGFSTDAWSVNTYGDKSNSQTISATKTSLTLNENGYTVLFYTKKQEAETNERRRDLLEGAEPVV